MRRSFQTLVLCILGCFSGGSGSAQSNDNAPLLLELPASVRAAGLGGAFVLSQTAHEAVFYNPSLLARGSTRMGISAGRYGGNSTYAGFAAQNSLGGGGLAIGLQTVAYGAFGPSLSEIPDDANEILSAGSYAVSELVGIVGYGREVFGINIGAAVKAVEMRIANGRDATAAYDFGVSAALFGGTVGAAVQNLGYGIAIDGESLPLPRRITVGISTPTRPIGPLDVVGTTTVNVRRDGEVIPSGGLELSWWPVYGRTFVGRIGLRRVVEDGMSPFTFGAAIHLDDVTIEYSFEDFDAPGASHRIGLNWR